MTAAACRSIRTLYVCGGRSFFARTLSRKLAEVAQCWRALGHEVTQVCGGDVHSPIGPGRVNETSPAGSTTAKWSKYLPEAAVTSISEYRDIKHDRLVLEHLRQRFRDFCPDLVWERSSRLHAAGLRFAREIGVPYVLEWKDHLVDYDQSLFRQRALALEARKTREADYVVVESHVLADTLAREGVDRGKIIVSHNAVHASEFRRDSAFRQVVRANLGVAADTVLVGYLGSYAFYHDALRLVLAMDLVRRDVRGVRVQALMVGSGYDAERLCRRRASELGLLDGALLMKPSVPQREVPGILSALDVAVLPGSTDIICPIKVQEYMAGELASIAPDYPCNREVVTDGIDGVLFRPGDERALAEAILRLAGDANLRSRIGAAGRRAAERRFSWEATWGAALETVLERATAIGRRRSSSAGAAQ